MEIISIIISIISALAWVITQFNQIKQLKEEVNTLKKNMEALAQQQNSDKLSFTEVIGKVNVTLAEFSITLREVGKTLSRIDANQTRQDNDIRDILRRGNGTQSHSRDNS